MPAYQILVLYHIFKQQMLRQAVQMRTLARAYAACIQKVWM